IDPVLSHNQPLGFHPVFIEPSESLSVLLDGKRTGLPLECMRSRLLSKSEGNKYKIENIEALQLNLGDPIIIMSELNDDSEKLYAIVKEINDNEVVIWETGDHKPFLKGAIIQNLSNRWHKENMVIGAKSQLK